MDPRVCVMVGRFMSDTWEIGTKHLGGWGCCHCHNATFSGAQCGVGAVLDMMVRPTTEETEVVGQVVLAFHQEELTVLTQEQVWHGGLGAGGARSTGVVSRHSRLGCGIVGVASLGHVMRLVRRLTQTVLFVLDFRFMLPVTHVDGLSHGTEHHEHVGLSQICDPSFDAPRETMVEPTAEGNDTLVVLHDNVVESVLGIPNWVKSAEVCTEVTCRAPEV